MKLALILTVLAVSTHAGPAPAPVQDADLSGADYHGYLGYGSYGPYGGYYGIYGYREAARIDQRSANCFPRPYRVHCGTCGECCQDWGCTKGPRLNRREKNLQHGEPCGPNVPGTCSFLAQCMECGNVENIIVAILVKHQDP